MAAPDQRPRSRLVERQEFDELMRRTDALARRGHVSIHALQEESGAYKRLIRALRDAIDRQHEQLRVQDDNNKVLKRRVSALELALRDALSAKEKAESAEDKAHREARRLRREVSRVGSNQSDSQSIAPTEPKTPTPPRTPIHDAAAAGAAAPPPRLRRIKTAPRVGSGFFQTQPDGGAAGAAPSAPGTDAMRP